MEILVSGENVANLTEQPQLGSLARLGGECFPRVLARLRGPVIRQVGL